MGWKSLTCSLWALSRGRPQDWLCQRENPSHSPFDLINDWTGTVPQAFWLLGSGGGGPRVRVRRLRTKMSSGWARGGDVKRGGKRGPLVVLGTLYLWAFGSRHKSATERWLWWLRRRRRQRRRQLWGLRLGVCRPPLLLGPGMYKWLVRILGTIFRFCDRPVPPARALLKRRRSNR